MSQGAKAGNKKSSKQNEPKRIRYNFEQRGRKRKFKDLKRHVETNPRDAQAEEALGRLGKTLLK